MFVSHLSLNRDIGPNNVAIFAYC